MLFLPPNLHHLSGTAFPTPPSPTPTPRCSRKPATNSQSVCCAGHIIARSGFCTLCASSRAVLQIPRDDCQTAERQTIPAREKAMEMPWNDWNAKVKYSLRLHARLFQGLLANRRSCTDRFWPLFLLAAGTGAEARQPALPCLSGFVSPDRLPPWRLLRAHRRLYGSSGESQASICVGSRASSVRVVFHLRLYRREIRGTPWSCWPGGCLARAHHPMRTRELATARYPRNCTKPLSTRSRVWSAECRFRRRVPRRP